MEYTLTKIDTSTEKNILLSMVISDVFMHSMEGILKAEYFQSHASKQFALWCLEYWEKYKKTPNRYIQEVVGAHSDELSATEKTYIDELLKRLQDLYDDLGTYNHDFFTTEAKKYCKKRRLEKFKDTLSSDLLAGNYEEAEKKIVTYEDVVNSSSLGIDIYRNIPEITKMGLSEAGVLMKPPSAFGEVTGYLRRGDMFMVLAPPKRGKTWAMQQMAIWANLMHRLNVLFVSLEMPLTMMKDRMYMQFLGRTSYPYTEPVTIPYFEEGTNKIVYIEKQKEFLTPEAIEDMSKKLKIMSRGKRLELMAEPSNSLTVSKLHSILELYEHTQGFIPDVLVIDYADLMISENRRMEFRHQLDDIWKSLRGLAQEKNILLITASQTTREGIKRDADISNIAEDIRKFAHITGGFVINQTPQEKERYYYRINGIDSRYSGFSKGSEAVVLQNLHIGKFYLDSRLKGEMPIDF